MYIDKDQKKSFRHEEFVQYLQILYANGRLIRDHEWFEITKLGRMMDQLNKRTYHLKNEALHVEHFLSTEIEEFIVLTQSYQKLLKVSINTADYLKKQLGKDVDDDDVIFETDLEALEAIEQTFLEIEEIKKLNEEYLTEEFE